MIDNPEITDEVTPGKVILARETEDSDSKVLTVVRSVMIMRPSPFGLERGYHALDKASNKHVSVPTKLTCVLCMTDDDEGCNRFSVPGRIYCRTHEEKE